MRDAWQGVYVKSLFRKYHYEKTLSIYYRREKKILGMI